MSYPSKQLSLIIRCIALAFPTYLLHYPSSRAGGYLVPFSHVSLRFRVCNHCTKQIPVIVELEDTAAGIY